MEISLKRNKHPKKAIENAIQQQITHGIYPSENIYGNGDAGQLIASVLAKAEVNIKKVINY